MTIQRSALWSSPSWTTSEQVTVRPKLSWRLLRFLLSSNRGLARPEKSVPHYHGIYAGERFATEALGDVVHLHHEFPPKRSRILNDYSTMQIKHRTVDDQPFNITLLL
jgi:hypothetical protein